MIHLRLGVFRRVGEGAGGGESLEREAVDYDAADQSHHLSHDNSCRRELIRPLPDHVGIASVSSIQIQEMPHLKRHPQRTGSIRQTRGRAYTRYSAPHRGSASPGVQTRRGSRARPASSSSKRSKTTADCPCRPQRQARPLNRVVMSFTPFCIHVINIRLIHSCPLSPVPAELSGLRPVARRD